MVISGDTTVKAVPLSKLDAESLPEINLCLDQLPDSSSPMTRTIQLMNARATSVIASLAPLAKLPRSLTVIQSKNLIIIRDYSASIKQQLKLLETLDQKSPR